MRCWFFFFSSRRRHTRFDCDWSSDVCSSDLVSIVSEDWRWRMFPNKGDYAGVPLNPEGRRVADAWDPAKDQTAGEQCKGYGAPAIMRIPGRFHMTWQDDQTLEIEADAGTQTR